MPHKTQLSAADDTLLRSISQLVVALCVGICLSVCLVVCLSVQTLPEAWSHVTAVKCALSGTTTVQSSADSSVATVLVPAQQKHCEAL